MAEDRTYRHLPRVFLVLRIADRTILLNNHRPAAVAVAHAGGPSVVVGEERFGITHELKLAVALHSVDLAPCAHDPSVVGGNDDNLVDTLGGELLEVLDVWWDVVGLAAGREGTWNRDKDDLLVLELLGGIEGLGHAACGRVWVGDRCPSGVECQSLVISAFADTHLHPLELDVVRELIADFERRHLRLW